MSKNKAKGLSTSPEAIRKRKARAEGRVKPRADARAARREPHVRPQISVAPWLRKRPTTHADLSSDAVGREVLAAIERDSGQSHAAIKAGLDYFDKVGGFTQGVKLQWGEEGNHVSDMILPRGGFPNPWPTADRDLLRKLVEAALTDAADRIEFERNYAVRAARLQGEKEKAGWTTRPVKAGAKQAKPPVKARTLAMTPEAIRKRRDRAAGKVKARPSRKKPPRSAAQWAAAAAKALATREAEMPGLVAAEAAGKVPAWRMAQKWKSLRRAQRTAETWKARAAEEASAASRPKRPRTRATR